jgi:hypothetical protein
MTVMTKVADAQTYLDETPDRAPSAAKPRPILAAPASLLAWPVRWRSPPLAPGATSIS